MISTISWVGRGVSRNTPIKYVETEEKDDVEVDTPQADDWPEKMDEESSEELSTEDKDVDSRYNLNDYDDEGISGFEASVHGEDGCIEFGENMDELMKYNPRKDPYLKRGIETAADMDDFLIRDTDLVILAGVSEDEEISHLDVYIFESLEVRDAVNGY